MLLIQSLVRVSFQDKPFEKRPIQVISFSFLYSQLVVVNFGTELPGKQKEE